MFYTKNFKKFLIIDFPINDKLKKTVHDIMEKNWNGIRVQLIYYICCSIGIISNYFFGALFTNMYHQIKGTPDYKHILSKAYSCFNKIHQKFHVFFYFNYIT